MREIQSAKIFRTGGSKALRIPAGIFAHEDQVWMKWNEHAQTLTITKNKPQPFAVFFLIARKIRSGSRRSHRRLG